MSEIKCRKCGVLLIGEDTGWCAKCRRKRSQGKPTKPSKFCYTCGNACICRDGPVSAAEYERRKAEAREWSASRHPRCETPTRAYLPSRVPREYHIEIASDVGPS